jgi:sulfatase maturation enzyme AslB (radical SAM superfamily)
MNKQVNHIDIMGSSNCNLKCSYCYINKNCSFSNYDKTIRQAWESGEYLKTVEKVL